MREEGYYFVKLYGVWYIAKYNQYLTNNEDGYWNAAEWVSFYKDSNFDKIGDKIELPKD
jgi:hypothetical protein